MSKSTYFATLKVRPCRRKHGYMSKLRHQIRKVHDGGCCRCRKYANNGHKRRGEPMVRRIHLIRARKQMAIHLIKEMEEN